MPMAMAQSLAAATATEPELELCLRLDACSAQAQHESSIIGLEVAFVVRPRDAAFLQTSVSAFRTCIQRVPVYVCVCVYTHTTTQITIQFGDVSVTFVYEKVNRLPIAPHSQANTFTATPPCLPSACPLHLCLCLLCHVYFLPLPSSAANYQLWRKLSGRQHLLKN